MRPKRSTAASTAACTPAASVTSRAIASRSSCSPRAAVTLAASRAVATTRWPAPRAARAMSTPMPRPAPVTRTTFLSGISCSFGAAARRARCLRALSASVADTPRTPAPGGGTGPGQRGTCRGPLRLRAAPTLGGMDDKEAARTAVREFLSSRRALVSPADAGLPVGGTRRRVKGLRREEVALLAGVSPEYYIRLERGQATGPSVSVVESVATVLRLDDDERSHLDRLLAALTPEARKRRKAAVEETISPGVRVVLASLRPLPAVVFNSRLDVLAANDLGRALYAPVFDTDGPPNTALFLFLDEHRARQLFPQWERIASDTVSLLRVEAGRRPDDPALIGLIGQLSTRSGAFRTRWAANDVRAHKPGVKIFRHPVIGEVLLPFENLAVDADGDQTLTVFTPAPGSPEHDAIQLLATWSASTSG